MVPLIGTGEVPDVVQVTVRVLVKSAGAPDEGM
jgi:hypothetical protein